MAGEYVFNLMGVTKHHEKKVILEDVNLAFFHGAHIGIIGANGAGKSSLLKILAGVDTEFMGECLRAKVKIGYLEQEPKLDPEKTVGECVNEGVSEARALLDRYDDLCCNLDDPKAAAEMERVQEIIDANDLWNLDHHVEMAMEALRLPPADAPVAPLSGGEKRRVAMCRLLISNPDVLLLDEPTNHLDAESVAWIEEFLKGFKGTLICVTHDRYFLNNVTEWILEMDQGRTYPYKGNYEGWLIQKQEAAAREAKQNETRRKMLEHELEWVRSSPGARRAKSKARLARYEEMAAKQVSTREDDLVIRIPPGPRLGDLVVQAKDLSMGFGDRLLFEHLDFDLPRGGVVGVIGANGAGKTTLFKLITGAIQPLSGELKVGPTVVVSHVDQFRSHLDDSRTVYEEITDGDEFIELPGGGRINGRAYCARFNLRGADQQKKVGVLSGGERNRVHLAKLLKSGGNLLLLDEPSNDLDVATLRSLEEGIQEFGGCAVVISHDRWFLDRIATHILAFEGDSKVVWFEGSYSDYHEHRRQLLGDKADAPRPIRFKPIRH
ncbi:MAG: energy-dependent translational throttle protein EttA [Kiritimatiellia bacterium]